MKTLFLGTPALAVPFLARLAEKTQVQAVITTPDQPAGRGYDVKSPAVKIAAEKLSLPVYQPETLKDPVVVEKIRSFGADVGIVVAYGKLLPKTILSVPRLGFLNVHFSLLPKYRGAAPIQWALVNGESETGVSLFWLDEGMDTGPLFLQKKMAIGADDTADTLRNKLTELGVQTLEEGLPLLDKGTVKRDPQSGPGSKAPLIKKEDGRIDWGKPAQTILNLLRGFTPWPGTYTGGLKILQARVENESGDAPVGSVVRLVPGEGPVVKCGRHSLVLLHVQPEGKKAMSAWSWWQGAKLNVGDQLG